MLIKWIQSIVQGGKADQPITVAAAKKGDAAPVPGELIDIAHKVMREDLIGLERGDYPFAQRQKLKERVRRKVKTLSLFQGQDDLLEEMLEEVTEKITEAAEADPYYHQNYQADETKK